MTASSRVAVIVTCFNQQRFIRQALDSIAVQTRPADEVVIIDGGSSDHSVAVIREWLAAHDVDYTFIVHQKNVGLCATLNQAMSLITSDYVVTLYGDDWLEPDRLERQARIFDRLPPNVAMLVGSMREVDRRGRPVVDHDFTERIAPLLQASASERVEALVQRNVIPSPGLMLRSHLVHEVGGYDEQLTFDDYDMWMRLLSVYDLAFDPAIVVNYRILDFSLSRSEARKGDFLVSEAKMIFKHRDLTPTINARIAARLTASARELATRGDRKRLRVVVTMLAAVAPRPRHRLAAWLCRVPGGSGLVTAWKLLEES